jgi:ATP-dependent helicase/nuclease subunit A
MTISGDIPTPRDFPHIMVVQASAGAGKTYSLALRFLQLLARARGPSPAALGGILALTFTVSAAQEMKSRIIAFLKDIALQTPSGELLAQQSGLPPEAANGWLNCILNHFQRFQVKTIDSLHFQLVQALGRRMHLWPELQASFDQPAWAKLMLNGLLARTDWNACSIADQQTKNRESLLGIWEEIFAVYLHLEMRPGLHFLPWLENQVKSVVASLDQLLFPVQITTLQNLRVVESNLLQECLKLKDILLRHGLHDQISRLKALDVLAYPVHRLDSAFFHKTAPEQLFKKKALSNPGIPEVWQAYTKVCRLRNAFLLTRAQLQVSPLASLQHVIKGELERLGQSQGLLLGGGWTRLLRQHLVEDGLLQEAQMILGAQWRHVLIDEFQDTSREQWEVIRELALEALSEGGSLFCVGDVKQAIYGWRGGDWRLFSEPLCPDAFPNVPQEHRKRTILPYNRRSCQAVVHFNNACFATLEQPHKCSTLASAMIPSPKREHVRSGLSATICELYADAVQTPWKACAGIVRVLEISGQDAQTSKTSALQTLAETIVKMHAQGSSLGDIAVLVRTNAETGECAQILLKAGISTITEQSLLISGHPLIRGLLALLTWLDNPGDDAALFALCRNTMLFPAAPGMNALLSFSKSDASPSPLFIRLRQSHPEFWNEHLLPFWHYSGFASAYELLLAAVAHFHLRNLPLGQWAWVEKLLESACNAEVNGVATLSGFLDFWSTNGSSCVVGLPNGLAAVRVMTMHKAKGLEFPQVILPLLGYAGKGRNAHVLLFSAQGEPSLASTSKPRSLEVAEIVDQEHIKALAEELNLLYVALTRAKQELYVFLPRPETCTKSHVAGWLRALMPVNAPCQAESGPCCDGLLCADNPAH